MKKMSKEKMERRYTNTTIELRDIDAEPIVSGYAARFNEQSEVLWGFREVILPGAFKDALEAPDIRALFNHDPSQIVARTKNNTLRVWEDEKGLRYEFRPNMKTAAGRDLVELLRRGDVDQSSFAFSMEGGIEEWDHTGNMPIRKLIKIPRLYDVSPVTYPAYPSTSVGVRSVKEVFEEHLRSIEKRGVDPGDVSSKLAPEAEPWEAPSLEDFTDEQWGDLSGAEKRRIAKHFAWAATMPPETYGDLKFPHHRPSDGAVVWRAVSNAAARLPQANLPNADIDKVRRHLGRHYRQFDRTPPWEEDSARQIRLKMLRRKAELLFMKEVI